nr:hypothetical protein [Tanacetum cinerariifolium]
MCSTSSAVTYTSVYTDSEPGRVFWGADEELSDGDSPRVIVYGYNGLPMPPVAPPSPNYIPGLEEPQTPPAPQYEDEDEPMFIQPHDPDFVPEPIYPEYIPLEDEHILPAEEQPLPPVVSPTAESPGYVVKDDETEDDDADDEDKDEEDEKEEEEEEHLAPADSAIVLPTDELVSPHEGTEPIIPPPSTDTATTGARITTSISLPPEAEVESLLAMPTPSPSPLTLLSPPSAWERLARCTAPAALPSPQLPPSLYPLPPVDRRDDIPESEQPPRKRLCLSTLGYRYEVGESSTRGRGIDYGFFNNVKAEMRHRGNGEVGYGIRDTWIDPAKAVPEMAPTTSEKVNTRVTELAELNEHDTQDLYALLEDAQDGRTRISQRLDSPVVTLQSPIQTPQVPQDEDKHDPMFIQPHDHDYVPEPMYPEYIPLEDEHVLPFEEKPLPHVVSPTSESPEYVAESNPEEGPEEYEDDETEDGSVDYPIDGGDDGDDDNDDSSGDDAEDEDEDEDEDEEEEHLAPADIAIIIPTIELVSPPKGTEPVIPPPSTDTTTTGARITVRLQATISLPPEAEVERLLAMPTPLPSPLASLLPPSAGERLARCMAPSAWPSALIGVVTTALPSPPLPPPLYIPPLVERRDDVPKDPAEIVPEIAPMIVGEVNTRVIELAEIHEHDTQDLYALLKDAQDNRTRVSQRVAMDSQWVDFLMEDRIAHQKTILIDVNFYLFVFGLR